MTPVSVPTAIQADLGLKAKAVTLDPASNSAWAFSQLLKSQTLTLLSFPPVTMKVPLGEVVKALMFPSWALKESLISKDCEFQILSLPSHPVEAKKELAKLPLETFLPRKETLETQSEWLFSGAEVNLQAPLTFQSLTTLSDPLEMICLLSEEKAHERTSLLWPTNLWVVTPFFKSQSLMDLSHEEDKR